MNFIMFWDLYIFLLPSHHVCSKGKTAGAKRPARRTLYKFLPRWCFLQLGQTLSSQESQELDEGSDT